MSLSDFKNVKTDRQKIVMWLESIGAPEDEADEVLELCYADPESRAYYVMRYDAECNLTSIRI